MLKCNEFVSLCIPYNECVCTTFKVLTGCESCTRPIATNTRYAQAGEYGLTRGGCFDARRLEVVVVTTGCYRFRVFWVRRESLFRFSFFAQ